MDKCGLQGTVASSAHAPRLDPPEEEECNSNIISDQLAAHRVAHKELRHLERTIDAYLVVQKIRDLSPAAVVENDAEFVETIYRRLQVESVYRELQRADCIQRLDDPAPRTEQLVESLRRCGADSEIGPAHGPCGGGQVTPEADTINPNTVNGEASLLCRVMEMSVHPLLKGDKASEWKQVVKDDKNLSIHVRTYDDNSHKLSFRVEGVVQAPLLCILSVLNEVDLFTKWIPYFRVPFKLGLREVTNVRLGRVDQLVQFHADFPWPFANRDALFEVFAVDDFERNNQIVVKMATPHSDTPRLRTAIPAPGKGIERIVVDGSLVIKPLGRDASRVSLVWHENCRMHVPLKMLDFVSRMFARTAFRSFESACQAAMHGEHKMRRAGNPFLYKFVFDRLCEVGLEKSLHKVSKTVNSCGEEEDFSEQGHTEMAEVDDADNTEPSVDPVQP